jgi:predicted dehydrogenase
MKKAKVTVGVVGCGAISGAYFNWMKKFPILDVVACSDLLRDKAEARSKEFGVPRVMSVDELLADKGIDIVLNLTITQAHAPVNLAAIAAGKNVYVEKPLGIRREEGKAQMDAAAKKKVLVGCAPDTFFGGGAQTCRRLIDQGVIGEPVACTAFMCGHGHESWHPSPEFYYKKGGGPMFDMGPYYLTALVNMLGPISRVSGSTRITFPERTITSKPLYGKRIKVETPTHIAGTMDFASGAIGTIVMSFDTWRHHLPVIEVYGTEGTLVVPDPNGFGGPVGLRLKDQREWRDVELTHSTDVGRGMGVADMAYAIAYKRANRASGALAYHVLDVMQSFEESSKSGRHVAIKSQCERPKALPVGLEPGMLDK